VLVRKRTLPASSQDRRLRALLGHLLGAPDFLKADEVDGSRSRHLGAQGVKAVRRSRAKWEPSAMQIITIGLDLAKSVFQIHGVDATGQVAVRKSLRRSQMLPFFAKLPPCLVGIEACGTSHHWARELIKLGHEVRLMPPAYVKPYVKRGKTDAADAEAVCEAVTRPTMRFVPVKTPEQQAALSIHRTRDLLVKQRTQLINMIRGLLAEFGVDIPKGLERALLMARQIVDGKAPEVPIEAARIVATLSQQALDTHVRLRGIDRDLAVWLRGNDLARRLMTIPGIGPVSATALAASVTDPHQFRSGRQFAAWLGLTPLQKSSGGKERLGRISKMGDKYLRKLLIVGMTALVRRAKYNPEKIDSRLAALLARKPIRVATVAMANKTARTIWAIMARGETYRAGHRPALAA
jgi:transposase